MLFNERGSRHCCYDSDRGEADKRASACATFISIIKHLIFDLYAYMDIKYIEIHLALRYDV